MDSVTEAAAQQPGLQPEKSSSSSSSQIADAKMAVSTSVEPSSSSSTSDSGSPADADASKSSTKDKDNQDGNAAGKNNLNVIDNNENMDDTNLNQKSSGPALPAPAADNSATFRLYLLSGDFVEVPAGVILEQSSQRLAEEASDSFRSKRRDVWWKDKQAEERFRDEPSEEESLYSDPDNERIRASLEKKPFVWTEDEEEEAEKEREKQEKEKEFEAKRQLDEDGDKKNGKEQQSKGGEEDEQEDDPSEQRAAKRIKWEKDGDDDALVLDSPMLREAGDLLNLMQVDDSNAENKSSNGSADKDNSDANDKAGSSKGVMVCVDALLKQGLIALNKLPRFLQNPIPLKRMLSITNSVSGLGYKWWEYVPESDLQDGAISLIIKNFPTHKLDLLVAPFIQLAGVLDADAQGSAKGDGSSSNESAVAASSGKNNDSSSSSGSNANRWFRHRPHKMSDEDEEKHKDSEMTEADALRGVARYVAGLPTYSTEFSEYLFNLYIRSDACELPDADDCKIAYFQEGGDSVNHDFQQVRSIGQMICGFAGRYIQRGDWTPKSWDNDVARAKHEVASGLLFLANICKASPSSFYCRADVIEVPLLAASHAFRLVYCQLNSKEKRQEQFEQLADEWDKLASRVLASWRFSESLRRLAETTVRKTLLRMMLDRISLFWEGRHRYACAVRHGIFSGKHECPDYIGESEGDKADREKAEKKELKLPLSAFIAEQDKKLQKMEDCLRELKVLSDDWHDWNTEFDHMYAIIKMHKVWFS